MAEAVFEDGDEHPIEAYLREASELGESAVAPGGLNSFYHDSDPFQCDSAVSKLARSLIHLMQPLVSTPSHSNDFAQRELAERLKYLVISSPLLSTSLSAHGQRRSSGLRTPSLLSTFPPISSRIQPEQYFHWTPFQLTVAASTPLVLMAGHFSLGLTLLLFCVATHFISRTHDSMPNPQRPPHLLQTIASVEALIAAGAFWDTVVTEGLSVLEREERSLASSPTAVDSQVALRVALMSTLNTTESQCDNIRNLFTPLTSPPALSQLSEMYAPPATKPSVLSSRPLSPELSRRLSYTPLSNGRPHTLRLSSSRSHESFAHTRGQSASAMLTSNRASWFGTPLSAGTLTMPHSPLSRREKRRSALPALFVASRTMLNEPSPLPSPAGEKAESVSLPSSSPARDRGDIPSGLLRRHSARAGLSLNSHRFMADGISEHPLRVQMPMTPTSLRSSTPARSPAATVSAPSSRFTNIPRAIPPGSFAAMRQTLDAALASRRYAVAHLLALRFDEETGDAEDDDFILVPEERDDDAYWEVVRSVVDLLTTALDEASSRMVEALEESEEDAARVAQPSPLHSPTSDLAANEPPPSMSFADLLLFPPGLHPAPGDSFAPGPSNMARLASHMDSIAESMGNVKENLSELANAIRAYQQAQLSPEDSPRWDELRSQTLTCYERLRRELGLGLRECERSRSPLQNVLWPPAPTSRQSFDDAPELTTSESSSSSCDSGSGLSHDSPEPSRRPILLPAPDLELPGLAHDDDATIHLLRDASAAHLPPPGIEQVFEAASAPPGSGSPLRERSKLSRAERIELAKAKREVDSSKRQSLIAALGFNWEDGGSEQLVDKESRDTWGPSPAVVEELKDAIWRVGERRRRLVDSQSPQTPEVRGARQILDQQWQQNVEPASPAL